ncbi:hypothetical protein C4564_06280 [Candidatus Microgenomates bacterium]|nr:MAG: hypothetical protein C4564_06280 [Candidatus Microgenomates bacterium]
MRSVIVAIVFVLMFSFSTNHSAAALLEVDSTGEVKWNILAYESDTPRMEIRATADNSKSNLISLNKLDHGFVLTATENGQEKTLDVDGYRENVIEIEAVEAPRKLSLSVGDSEIKILQNGITAKTSMEVQFNAQENTIGFVTSSGVQYLSVLPAQAVDQLVRANIVTTLPSSGEIELSQVEGALVYNIQGQRELKISKLFNLPVDVSATVSASSGSILDVNQPIWATVLSILFS